MPEKKPEADTGIAPEELEQQEGEPLPDREAMSLLQPDPMPYPLPVPIDDTGTDTRIPESGGGYTLPVEPPAKE